MPLELTQNVGFGTAEEATPAVTNPTLNLDASQNDVNVRAQLNNPTGVLTVRIEIADGVEIGSNQFSGSTAALDVGVGWDVGTTFIFDFNASATNRIQGYGGFGGGGGESTISTTGSGGGGGGGRGLTVGRTPEGGPGGTGAGNASDGADGDKDAAGAGGGGGGNATNTTGAFIGLAGGAAIDARGYAIEIIGGKVYGGGGGGGGGGIFASGGAGGDYGTAGSAGSGATPPVFGAAGGPAGAAVINPNGITQTSSPDIQGSIS